MKAITAILATLFCAQAAHAFEVKIPCRDDESHRVLPISAIKTSEKDASGKWDSKYFLEAHGKRYELISAGSGDEDYNDFDVKTPEAVGIMGASVQNRFEWVALINVGGSSFATCRK